jgi:hypothetical protein
MKYQSRVRVTLKDRDGIDQTIKNAEKNDLEVVEIEYEDAEGNFSSNEPGSPEAVNASLKSQMKKQQRLMMGAGILMTVFYIALAASPFFLIQEVASLTENNIVEYHMGESVRADPYAICPAKGDTLNYELHMTFEDVGLIKLYEQVTNRSTGRQVFSRPNKRTPINIVHEQREFKTHVERLIDLTREDGSEIVLEDDEYVYISLTEDGVGDSHYVVEFRVDCSGF